MLLHRHRFPLLCCSTRAAVLNGAGTDKGAVVRQLTWAEVEAMTGSFTSAVVGEGGSSTVYLGRLPQQLAAVKVHRSSQRLRRAFRHELHALLRARHPHIVRLLAFCDQTDEGVLVLELAPNGSLHDHLHGSDPQGGGASSPAPAPVPVPWARRVRVALQVARALEYLHEACEPQVVHGDVKASNVLLDAAMDARLCDFGSAHAGFSDSVRPTSPRGGIMVGSPGYVDPHYLRSGLVTKKSDVYSFGVLLLELLTGAPPFSVDDGRPLASIVAPMIRAGGTGHGPVCDVRKLVDKKLGCRYDEEEAVAVAGLAAACVGENPTLRPSMTDVVRTLQKISAVGRRSDGGGKP